MSLKDRENINKSLKNLEDTIDDLENYYEGKKAIHMVSTPGLQSDSSNLITEINALYHKTLSKRGESQEEIKQKNDIFEKTKLKLDEKLGEYIINKDKKSSSTIFKLDIYDRNIEDNLFLIYYFLSYGILGLFIYKLLK